MIYFLILLLVLLLVLNYIFFDRNILSPSVIATAMFLLSSVIAALNVDIWRFSISPETVIFIIVSLIAFSLGEFLLHLMICRRKISKNTNIDNHPFKPSFFFIAIISFVILIILFAYYKETLRVAKEAGYKSNQSGALMLAYARVAVLNSKGTYSSRSGLVGIGVMFARATAYVLSYVFLQNKIIYKQKGYFRILVPVILYLPIIVLSTGRTDFIYFITVWLIVGSVFYLKDKKWNPRYSIRIVFFAVIGIILFLTAFVIAGSFKSDKLAKNIFSTISFYSGMSIPSLDYYLVNYVPSNNEVFGEHTLFYLYSILRKFDSSIPKLYAPLEFVSFNGVRGNVYTALRRYFQDFNYLGLFLIMFFLGFLYSYMFARFRNKNNNLGILFYASILAPVVEISIEERFFMMILTPATLYTLFFMFIEFKIIFERNFFCFDYILRYGRKLNYD